jgi:hypothetical protein
LQTAVVADLPSEVLERQREAHHVDHSACSLASSDRPGDCGNRAGAWRFIRGQRSSVAIFFGASNDMELSIWMGLGFAPLAVGFFLAGIFESIVLMNFGPLWLVVVPLFTGLAAIFLPSYG